MPFDFQKLARDARVTVLPPTAPTGGPGGRPGQVIINIQVVGHPVRQTPRSPLLGAARGVLAILLGAALLGMLAGCGPRPDTACTGEWYRVQGVGPLVHADPPVGCGLPPAQREAAVRAFEARIEADNAQAAVLARANAIRLWGPSLGAALPSIAEVARAPVGLTSGAILSPDGSGGFYATPDNVIAGQGGSHGCHGNIGGDGFARTECW